MRNLTIYLALLLFLFASKIVAQETFEAKAKTIALKIENIIKDEKNALKIEVDAVNRELESGAITEQQADEKKMKLSEIRSKNIETKVSSAQEELKDLVQQKVDGKIESVDTTKTYGRFLSLSIGGRERKNDTIKKGEKRTTSQFVMASGVNNLVTDKSVANSDFRYWGSHFYELGITYNTRILKNDNLLHFKYGVSVMYNNLRATNNRAFVVNGNQTNLETSSINICDSRFKNVYVVAPLHLEFDFAGNKIKDGKSFFKTHQSVRLGIGGFAGARVKSKQILKYENDGRDVTERTRGNFNANDFIYGVSTYIGYKETSLYLKYDLNPLFSNNPIKQNNISLGVRFDFN